MTDLNKRVVRKSSGRVFEKGQNRRVLIVLVPPAKIGFRLEGTRDTYTLDAESAYSIAVKFHAAAIDRRTKQLQKSGLKMRTARAQARKELRQDLKI